MLLKIVKQYFLRKFCFYDLSRKGGYIVRWVAEEISKNDAIPDGNVSSANAI